MLTKLYMRSPILQRFYRKHLARYFQPWIRNAPYAKDAKHLVARSGDPVRYAAIGLALQRIKTEKIPGAIAEVGVYRGDLSGFLSKLSHGRTFYLFDTFSGFPEQDRGGFQQRFMDTSIEAVKQRVNGNAVFRPGYFPETASGLEEDVFAFVSLDVDLYNPTLAGLQFFWPRLSPGGYIFVHDYYTGYPIADAVRDSGITEFIELPDKSGSVIFRKPR